MLECYIAYDLLLEACNPYVQAACVKCFSTIQLFGHSKTFTYLGILFGNVGCTMTAATLPE